MKGYRIYNYQRDVLIQQTMANGDRYCPVLDINGDYFIFEKEHRNCGLGELMDFVPPVEEIPG